MDWSYVAGYFDGEGCVNHSPNARGSKTRQLGWFNTHKDSLCAMRDFMGVGTVIERSPNHSGFGGRKPAYALYISKKVSMLHVLNNMIPHLMIKRAKAEALRTYLIDHVDESRMVNFGKVAAVSTEQLLAWYASGESFGDIARRLGVGHVAVLQAFRARGLTPRTQEAATSLKQKGVPKSSETVARMKVAQRANWDDPVFVARQAELRDQNKEARAAAMRTAQLARWADPVYRERMKTVRRAQYEKPETRAAMTAAQRARRDKEAQQKVLV